MICQAPQNDTIHKSRFSLSLNSSSMNDVTKRHSYHQDIKRVFPMEVSLNNSSNIKYRSESGIHNNEQYINNSNNKDESYNNQHWEKIESYYIKRLDSLAKEIETSTAQNNKLAAARDELLQEILQLHQKSVELNIKNNSLIRSIAEKENHISAFMYNDQTFDGSNVNCNENTTYGRAVGVTLIDQPYSLPSSSINNAEEESTVSNENNKSLASNSAKKEANSNSQPGIFRQISLRLSSRKRRQQEDSNNAPLNISQPMTANNNLSRQSNDAIPVMSSSEPLLHPAAVVNTSIMPMEYDNNQYLNKRKNAVFGSDLIQLAQSEKSVIPTIVLKCIREIDSRGLPFEGIYRKSGTFAQIKELQDLFEEKKCPTLSKYQDINVIASVLKLYFRELSTPLIPNEFILPSTLSPQERLNKTYTLLHNMPIEPYCTIKFLVQHLKRVHQNYAQNKMTSKNLAVVFGPTLMRFIAGNEEQQMNDMINTVDYIILQSHILFADYYS